MRGIRTPQRSIRGGQPVTLRRMATVSSQRQCLAKPQVRIEGQNIRATFLTVGIISRAWVHVTPPL